MSRIFLGSSQLLLFLLWSTPLASASPIVLETRDFHGSQRNFRILDTETGSVWISPAHTNGLTADTALAEFAGYRLPLRGEVVEMFVDFGLPHLGKHDNEVGVPPHDANRLRQLMSDGTNVVGTYLDPETELLGRIGLYTQDDGPVLRAEAPIANFQQPMSFEGHWLVQPVPEPSSVAIAAIGLIGFVIVFHRSVIMAKVICRNCGHMGRPSRLARGSFLVEIVLWCFFLFPGLIYSCWRASTRYRGCRLCRSQQLVPLQSPEGRRLLSPDGTLS